MNFLRLPLLRSQRTPVVHLQILLCKSAAAQHPIHLIKLSHCWQGKLSWHAYVSAFSSLMSRRSSFSSSPFQSSTWNKTSPPVCPDAPQILVKEFISFLSEPLLLLLCSLPQHITNLLNYRPRNSFFLLPSLCQCLLSGPYLLASRLSHQSPTNWVSCHKSLQSL